MATDYIPVSPDKDCLNTSHSYIARSTSAKRRGAAENDGIGIEGHNNYL